MAGERGEERTRPDQNEIDSPENRELSLPELKLTQLVKSEAPVDTWSQGAESEKKGKIGAIESWNNYTLVSVDEQHYIKIYDENAQEIEGLNMDVKQKRIEGGKLGEVKDKLGNKQWISRQPLSYATLLDNVPVELLAQIKFAMGKNDRVSLSDYDEMHEFTVSNIAVLPDNNIILYSKEGAVVTLITKSNKGVALAPRDWSRLNPKDDYPDELRTQIEKVVGEQEGFKEINDQYSVNITDVGISIMRNDDKERKPVYAESTPSVEKNITVDPANPNVFYYCQTSSPRSIKRLDLSGEPGDWKPVEAPVPGQYDSISNLQLDPQGNFFLFYSGKDLVVITKDTLQEVKREENLTNVNFDNQGNIRAVDADGHLVIYEANFDELAQELDKHRIDTLTNNLEELDIGSIFDVTAAKVVEKEQAAESMGNLRPVREKYEAVFQTVLDTVTTPEGIEQIRQQFNKLRSELSQKGLKPPEIAFIISGMEAPIREKEKKFASEAAEQTIKLVGSKLEGGLSFALISEARDALDSIAPKEALLEKEQRMKLTEVRQQLEDQTKELFRHRGGEVKKDIDGLIERTKTDLAGFKAKSEMDDWMEFRYPQIKSRLAAIARDVPMEADDIYQMIRKARTDLDALAQEYEQKFRVKYAKVRESAAERIGEHVDSLRQEIASLDDRLRAKGFTDRTSAEQYLETSEARQFILSEIEALSADNPDAAKELERALKVRLSNTLTEIERGGKTNVAETGQQMVQFGEVQFPRHEAKVREKGERSVSVIFQEDQRTHGPGVKPGDILGDVALSIRTADGNSEQVRLYEDWDDENEYRLGLLESKGQPIEPSYLSASDFAKFKKIYSDWSKGEGSALRKELQEKRDVLKDLYKKREKLNERTETDNAWKEEYKKALKDYAEFSSKKFIPLLRRIESVQEQPDIERTNGKGFVPEWQSHWVMDKQTELDLQDMAENFKMQTDLQEGLLNLKGHAGSGKDVRIKMFCNMTNRPYFGMDGTKWTTEFELSEDVMLESKDGASQTVKVPSTILNGIQTPGAVVYFNEFNAMPEQAQIFLHALMDEKRSLTLKTSSGKTIKADPSVLMVGSMNPNYPGTFEPQFATRSRMVSQEVGYPPMTREADKDDPNQNPVYDSSEALRVARGVDSLADLTYEASLEHNEFVKTWDQYVNGIDRGMDEPRLNRNLILILFWHWYSFPTHSVKILLRILKKAGIHEKHCR